MSGIRRSLQIEAEAARSLLANIRDVIGDDEEMAHDAVEGETGLIEAITSAVARIGELEAFESAIAEQVKALSARKARFGDQAERIRTAVMVAMGMADLKNLELASVTLSRKTVPPKVVITDEAAIPSRFWKPSDPTLDKKALLAALKAKEPVAGAELSNGAETISILRS